MLDLSCKICAVLLLALSNFRLLIAVLGLFVITDEAACCYLMTASEMGS